MNDISDLAARWGVAPEYFDAFGERRMVAPQTLAHIVDAISGGRAPAGRLLPATLVARQNRANRVEIPTQGPGTRIHWQVLSGDDEIRHGTAEGDTIVLTELPTGTYRLRIVLPTRSGEAEETTT